MLHRGCDITARLCYHFFHANVFHAICNIWCLLALAFYYDIEDWELLLAFIIAATVPSVAMASQPIVGASGVCFALMGIVFHKVARKKYYLSWIIPIVAIGFIIPGMAATLHLYCFAVGIAVALVYSKVRRFVIRKKQ
jgi:membrane associated rhomboid family serine protease